VNPQVLTAAAGNHCSDSKITHNLSHRSVCYRCCLCVQLCQLCCRDDNEAQLLLCDQCDRGYHTYCIKVCHCFSSFLIIRQSMVIKVVETVQVTSMRTVASSLKLEYASCHPQGYTHTHNHLTALCAGLPG